MTVNNHSRGRGGFRAALTDLFGKQPERAPYAVDNQAWRPLPDHDGEVSLSLKSRDDLFDFTVTVRLIVTSSHNAAVTNSFQIGKVGIQRRAQQVAERYSLLDAEQLCDELTLALTQPAEINGTGVVSRAVCLSVAVDEQDTEALRRYRESQRVRHLADLNAELRREEIAYFNDLLTDPRQATAWWFHHNSAKVEQLPAVAETFKTLRGQLRPPEEVTPRITDLSFYGEPDNRGAILEDFLTGADEPTALVLDRFVTRLFEQHQQVELLERWRRLTEPPPESPDAHDS